MAKGLPTWKKLIFSSGDWGLSSAVTLRSFFYAIFLTDVVGLTPQLASFGAFAGVVWDALNDPLVGILSDRVRTRWGRRRPFLLFCSIPFGLSLIAMWATPKWDNQIALTVYVTLAFILADTFYTLVAVPFYALTPEVAPDYDERTTLMGMRSFFQLFASITTTIAAPMIVDTALRAGMSQQAGYLIVSSVFGLLGAIPFLVIFFLVRETTDLEIVESPSLSQAVRIAWSNVPFRFAAGIYMFNWTATDSVSVGILYFLTYWVASGDLLASVSIPGMQLSLESAFFALLMGTSALMLPFWAWLGQRLDKRPAYIIGMAWWVVIQLLVMTVQPGQVAYLLVIAILAGIGIAAAYVLPESMFADIIEWDELRSGQRQEGIYFGVRALIRKLTSALAIFLTLQLLGLAGYQTPPEGVTSFQQPENALLTIRLMVSPLGALLLLGAIVMAWFYPLTREKHARIRRLLEMRKERVIQKEIENP